MSGLRIPLTETIQALTPHLAPALTTLADMSQVQALARALPPIHRGGFECRLSAQASRVDLEQAILGYGGEPEILIAHIDRLRAAGEVHPAWQRLRDFCVRWADPASTLHERIPAIWLELDVGVLAPSLFFTLRPEGLSGSQAYAAVEKALAVLAPPSAWPRDRVRRCFEVGTGLVYVHWFGVMLARPAGALRFVVHPWTPEYIAPYLERIGWPGPADELAALVAQLGGFVDRIDLVGLDVGDRVHPRIGLECVFEQQPHREPRWDAFGDYLISRRLCTPEKRDALWAWPGYTDPAPVPLPQMPHSLEVIRRRVNHIKIVYQPGRPLEAKAYLWFDRARFDLQGTVPAPEENAREG